MSVPCRSELHLSECLTTDEVRRRRLVVDFARGLIAYGGGHSSAEAHTDEDAWIFGEITLDQLLARAQH